MSNSRYLSYSRHEKEHKKECKCDFPGCNFGSGFMKGLRRHQLEVHGIPADDLDIRSQCPHCEYEGRKENVKRHMEKKHK